MIRSTAGGTPRGVLLQCFNHSGRTSPESILYEASRVDHTLPIGWRVRGEFAGDLMRLIIPIASRWHLVTFERR